MELNLGIALGPFWDRLGSFWDRFGIVLVLGLSAFCKGSPATDLQVRNLWSRAFLPVA